MVALTETETMAILESIEEGKRHGDVWGNPEVAATYSAYCKIENLLSLLRESSQVLEQDGDFLDAPAQIDRFQIRSVLGQGGFATVYLAFDPELERQVAIKVPRADAFASIEDTSRFLTEARLTAGLNHPGIITVHDVKQSDGQVVIVMEYVEGRTMETWLAELAEVRKSRGVWPRPSDEHIVWFFAQLADALHYAHRKGFIHRDLKPSNVLIDEQGRPHIADFGLAVPTSRLQKLADHIAGTPAYMSPEQVMGKVADLDARTDIWSLGVMLYELLSGRRPFRDAPLEACFFEIRERQPVRIDGGPLEAICFRAISKHADRRFRSAEVFADHLRSIEAHGARKPRRLALAASALLVLIVACVIYYVATLEDNDKQTSAIEKQGDVTSLSTYSSVAIASATADSAATRSIPKSEETTLQNASIAQKLAGATNLETEQVRSISGKQWVRSQTFLGSLSHVYCADLSPDGTLVVSGGADQYLRFWDAKSGELLREIRRMDSEVSNARFLRDARIICTVGRHRCAEIWNLTGTGPDLVFDNDLNSELYSLVLSNDELTLVTSGKSGIVTVWDFETRQQLRQLKHGLTGPVAQICLSPNGTEVACVNYSSDLAICSVSSGKRLRLLSSGGEAIRFANYAPNGKMLATAGGDGLVSLWNANSAECTSTIKAHSGNMRCVSFSRSGEFFASSGDDGKVIIWESATQQPLATLAEHVGKPAGVAFVGEDLTVLTWGDNKEINLWSPVSGEGRTDHP